VTVPTFPHPTFKTSDLSFAAFLRVAGVPFVGTEREQDKIYFLFEPVAGPSSLRSLKSEFYAGTAKVSALEYARMIRDLKTLVHTLLR
jgi:hypothetical protein